MLVTFKAFRKLAKRRHWTMDELTEEFKGKLEGTRDFFERVWLDRYDDVVIPYKSVLELYWKMESYEKDGDK